jgi:hypothetical protein
MMARRVMGCHWRGPYRRRHRGAECQGAAQGLNRRPPARLFNGRAAKAFRGGSRASVMPLPSPPCSPLGYAPRCRASQSPNRGRRSSNRGRACTRLGCLAAAQRSARMRASIFLTVHSEWPGYRTALRSDSRSLKGKGLGLNGLGVVIVVAHDAPREARGFQGV